MKNSMSSQPSAQTLEELAALIQRRRRVNRWRRLVTRPATAFALLIIIAAILMAAFAPQLAPMDPSRQQLAVRLRPPLTAAQGREYFLGTDQLGRDILSRIIYGTRVSLLVGFSSVLLALTIGTLAGLVSGFFGGPVDAILMRLTDIQMSFPFVLLALSIVAILGPSLPNVIIVFGLTSWVTYARTVRATTLSLRGREFITAARAQGTPSRRILFRHIAPNVVNPVIVLVSFEFARIITTEAALSYLGLGVPPTIPTWGGMINDGREYLQNAWWIAVLPGLILALLVVAINFLGDGLRQILDPRSKI